MGHGEGDAKRLTSDVHAAGCHAEDKSLGRGDILRVQTRKASSWGAFWEGPARYGGREVESLLRRKGAPCHALSELPTELVGVQGNDSETND